MVKFLWKFNIYNASGAVYLTVLVTNAISKQNQIGYRFVFRLTTYLTKSIDSFDSFNYYPCDKQVLQPGTRLFSRKQYCSQNGQKVNILIYHP